MIWHMTAFILGFLLDMLLGDPHRLLHPVVFIGKLIENTENRLRNEKDDKEAEIKKGKRLVVTVLSVTFVLSSAILICGYLINIYLGLIIETIMTYQILAARSLMTESMKVYDRLAANDPEGARKAVSMIVGRDTENLSAEKVAKAAIETVAENTSDGVIAPLIYTAIGGPVLGFLYKAVNTMDSMVGYKNEKYINFGRTAAKLDDIVNFIPSRISAYLMIAAAYILRGPYSGRMAYLIYKRDRFNHSSPNSAQTESVCAGALGIQLAGDASYFGKIVRKPFIGDNTRSVEYEDIKRANRLMYLTAILCEIICIFIMIVIYVVK